MVIALKLFFSWALIHILIPGNGKTIISVHSSHQWGKSFVKDCFLIWLAYFKFVVSPYYLKRRYILVRIQNCMWPMYQCVAFTWVRGCLSAYPTKRVSSQHRLSMLLLQQRTFHKICTEDKEIYFFISVLNYKNVQSYRLKKYKGVDFDTIKMYVKCMKHMQSFFYTTHEYMAQRYQLSPLIIQ